MKILAFGYFDGLHSGHVRFLTEAKSKGDELIVGVGNDESLRRSKGSFPLFSEASRVASVEALAVVDRAFLITGVDDDAGFGWQNDVSTEFPFSVFVNPGDLSEDRLRLLVQRSQEMYFPLIFSERDGAHEQSSSAARDRSIPYRVVLTSGADQLNLTKFGGGVCVGFPAFFGQSFPEGSGMATSTREAAKKIGRVSTGEEFARLAFAVENPPLSVFVDDEEDTVHAMPAYLSGAVDSILTFVPGVNVCDYAKGEVWPAVRSIGSPSVVEWLRRVVRIVQTPPRVMGFQMEVNGWDTEAVSRFTAATREVEAAVGSLDTRRLIAAMNEASEAFAAVSPSHLERIEPIVNKLRDRGFGVCVQGAGGGGCIAIVSEDHESEPQFRIVE